jgi:DNA-binding response OmpR family regulator
MQRSDLILVVEDEPNLREPLAHLLRLRHFDVIEADSVDSALQVLGTHHPDGAIVDLHLKRGSGREVVARMPSLAPVIIFSGSRESSGELERLRPGTELVEKPCSLTWLIDKLGGMLEQARSRAAAISPPAVSPPVVA